MEETADETATAKFLFVSQGNLPHIVAMIAPQLILIDREKFTAIAVQMLELVEAAAKTMT